MNHTLSIHELLQHKMDCTGDAIVDMNITMHFLCFCRNDMGNTCGVTTDIDRHAQTVEQEAYV